MNTTIIVGGGLSPVDRNWGQKIDTADRVIRMWDHSWQEPDDYGERYDVGSTFINDGPSYTGWPDRQRTPTDEWFGIVLLEKYKPLVPEFVKRTQYTDMIIYDGTRLSDLSLTITRDAPQRCVISRGVATAIAEIETHHPSHLVLVGFDNLRAGRITRSAHKPMNAERHNLRVAGRCDCLADGRLLAAFANEYSTQVRHAQEVWDN